MVTPPAAGHACRSAAPDHARHRVSCEAAAARPTVEEVGRLGAEAFTARFAGVFEHSAWVARGTWPTRPWATVEELHAAMVAVVDVASREQRLALLRAHPDLSGAAGRSADLTAASAAEQAAAGLDDLDDRDGIRLGELTRDYRTRFAFPFIACAREHTPASLLEQAAARLGNEPGGEERTALGEVAKIARLRLRELVCDPAPAR